MIRLIAAFILAATPVAAIELSLPVGARMLSERVIPLDDYAMPVGAYRDGILPTETFTGEVARRTWRINSSDLTTLQVLEPIRTQLEQAGYEVLHACKDTECGFFDFRFRTEITPAPDMYVDIRNFRYVAAQKANGEALSVLVSKSRASAYIQVIEVSPEEVEEVPTEPVADIEPAPEEGQPRQTLNQFERDGHIVLRDLEFETGAVALGPGPYQSLVNLAAYLVENPGVRIALVGHTDSVGGLAGNIDLSRRRAQAVRDRLIETYDIDADRLEADGVGYLAPAANNLDPQGREDNRRVEAVLLSLE